MVVLQFRTSIFISFSQNRQNVRGYVTDENNQPFPHVNIFLSTSKTGTVTNNNGAFSLTFSGTEDVLNASFIGYETQMLKVDKNTGFIKIRLKPSNIQLNEVLVTNLPAAALLKKAIEKIPENYPQEPFLSKAYYRAKLSENDTLLYMEETAFHIIKSYKREFEDEYFLVNNRNFEFKENTTLRRIAHYDIVQQANSIFSRGFFKRNDLKFLPGTAFDNRAVYVISIIPKKTNDERESRIFIDVDDLAFVRFELEMESGDKLTAQYRKDNEKYYLISGESLHINHRQKRILPAESNMVVTDIVYPFSIKDIEGISISREDILKVYATSAQDTLFWQQHNAILPDSAILQALEKHEAKRRDSAAIRNSEEYKARIKRLYTPHLSLMASTGLERDFSTFNHNTNSVNRYVSHLLQRNIRGTFKQLTGIYLYQALVSIPLEENAAEWFLLNKNGIRAKINPLTVNKYNSTYLYGMDNQQVSDFKTGNRLDFLRLHTVRNDGHYAKSFLIEEELAQADLSNKNNWFNYLQLYSMELLMHRGTNTYNPFKKDVKQHSMAEEKQPLIIDRNRSWVKYLFNPEAEYQRHVLNEDLSDEERKYLKRSAYWSWLNLVSPQMYAIPKFKLNERNSFTFSLNYLRTPFGEMFGQNIWLMHNYSQLHGIFIKQYRNYEKTTFGIGYKLYDIPLFKNLYCTTSFDIWQQPARFQFKTDNTFTGFHINQLFEYQFLPHKYIDRNKLSVFVGFDYKTKGYIPESYFMNENLNVKAGFKVNLK